MSQLQIAILQLMTGLAEKKSHELQWRTIGMGKSGEKGRKVQFDDTTGVITKGFGAGKTMAEAYKTDKNALASDIAQAAVKKHGKGTVGEYLRGGAHEMAAKGDRSLLGADFSKKSDLDLLMSDSDNDRAEYLRRVKEKEAKFSKISESHYVRESDKEKHDVVYRAIKNGNELPDGYKAEITDTLRNESSVKVTRPDGSSYEMLIDGKYDKGEYNENNNYSQSLKHLGISLATPLSDAEKYLGNVKSGDSFHITAWDDGYDMEEPIDFEIKYDKNKGGFYFDDGSENGDFISNDDVIENFKNGFYKLNKPQPTQSPIESQPEQESQAAEFTDADIYDRNFPEPKRYALKETNSGEKSYRIRGKEIPFNTDLSKEYTVSKEGNNEYFLRDSEGQVLRGLEYNGSVLSFKTENAANHFKDVLKDIAKDKGVESQAGETKESSKQTLQQYYDNHKDSLDIIPIEHEGREFWGVKGNLYTTKEGAEIGRKEASLSGDDRQKRDNEESQKQIKRQEIEDREVQRLAEQKAKKYDLKGFLEGKTALQQGKIAKDLDKQFNAGGLYGTKNAGAMSLRDMIEHSLKNEGELKNEVVFNQSKYDADDKKLRGSLGYKERNELIDKFKNKESYNENKYFIEFPNGSRLSEKTLGKTGIDYAKHLLSGESSQTTDSRPSNQAT